MAQPLGPIDVGGDLVTTANDDKEQMEYSLVFYPDAGNEDLRNAGKPMSFYYVPGRVRLAKEPNNDYMFHFQEFAGVLDQDTNVSVSKDYEIAGGLLTFSSTMEIPPEVFKKLTDSFTEKLKKQYASHPLLAWKDGMVPPNFSPVTLNSCDTKMDGQNFGGVMNTDDKNAAGGNVTFDIQGNGKGNLSSTGLDSFSTMLGLIPAACIKDSLLSGHSTIVVRNEFKYWVKSLGYHIKIHGDWGKVYDHFSGAMEGHFLSLSAKFEESFDSLRLTGAIVVDIEDNPFLIGKEGVEKEQQTKDMIMKMFFEKCQDQIFEKVPATEPAKADSGGTLGSLLGFGGGIAVKMKQVRASGTMDYDETYRTTLEKTTTATGNLEGIFHEIQASQGNKDTIAKYFTKVNIGSYAEKVHVVACANAYWTTPDQKQGDPIFKILLQVGYTEPDETSPKLKNAARFKDSPKDNLSDKNSSDISWTSDIAARMYVVDFLKNTSAPKETQNQIIVQKSIVFKEDPRVHKDIRGKQLDETITTDNHNVIINADTLGKFGAIFTLENADIIATQPKIHVSLTCRMPGFEDTVFLFDNKNVNNAIIWELWFKAFEDIPAWSYRVDVRVTGKKLTDKPVSWSLESGPKTDRGPLLNFLVPFPPVPDELAAIVDSYTSTAAPVPEPVHA